MKIADKAVSIITAYANDNSHGYDQARRWGPDFDCSSLIITCYEQAGVPVKTSGATYTGDMRGVFLRCGFADVSKTINFATGAGLLPGDVLLNYVHHTAMFIGGGRVAQARVNELGTVTGGKTGDQTGNEISIRSYYNYPWDCALRYVAEDNTAPTNSSEIPNNSTYTPSGGDELKLRIIRRGDTGDDVRAAQILLKGRGFDIGRYGTDGDFGYDTHNAVVQFQKSKRLTADGEIGPLTWAALLGAS